jgi:hypothetical protein
VNVFSKNTSVSQIIRGEGPRPYDHRQPLKQALIQPQSFNTAAIQDASTVSLSLVDANQEADRKLALMVTGAAIAAHTPVSLEVSDRKSLPYFLQEAEHIYPSVHIQVQSGPPLPEATPPPAHQVSEKFDWFLACQMTGLSDAQREDNNQRLHVIDDTLGGENYCQPFTIKNDAQGKPAYNTPADALKLSLDNLQDSKKCIFFFYDDVQRPRPPGMWVEAGHALMEGKECIFLVPDLSVLPSALQVTASELPGNLTVAKYDSHDQIPSLIRELTSYPSGRQVVGQ